VNDASEKIEPISVSCLLHVENQVWCGCSRGILLIWEIQKECLVNEFQVHKKTVSSLLLVGNRVWSGSHDLICIWNAKNHKLKKKIPQCPVTCFVHVNGNVWAGTLDMSLLVFDGKRYRLKKKIKIESGTIGSLLYYKDIVWVGTDSIIVPYSPETYKVLGYLQGHENKQTIHSLIGVAGNIWSASSDKSIRIWDAETGECLKKLEGHSSRVFTLLSEYDKYVWSGSWDRTIFIWNTQTHGFFKELKGKHTDAISSLISVRHLGQQRIWSGSWDSSISIWSSQNGPHHTNLETNHTATDTDIDIASDTDTNTDTDTDSESNPNILSPSPSVLAPLNSSIDQERSQVG